jgi:hypothetical protein
MTNFPFTENWNKIILESNCWRENINTITTSTSNLHCWFFFSIVKRLKCDQVSIFELVKILLSFNLNESEIALYSALILIRPGKENVIYPL